MTSERPHTAPVMPSFREACRFWWTLGWISFGGPAGQIALMHEALVVRRRWISESRFLHALNYCMVLPGPEAQQLATYLGWLMHRTPGGLVAGLLFILPSLFILLGLSWLYVNHHHTPAVASIFYGIKPVVTALVLQAAWRMGQRSLKTRPLQGIAIVSLLSSLVWQLPFPMIVGLAAMTGLLLTRLHPASTRPANHGGPSAGHAPALIDDHSPLPAHARFKRQRFITIAVTGTTLMAAPLLILHSFPGDLVTFFATLGTFFTQAALLTFGGAYAVLPYVWQGAVDQHQWLSAAQMMDGLALGETTPGPLIMVVTFVGYLAGNTHALAGGNDPVLVAMVAGLWVTWCTFLPSFIFILAGAPAIESSRHMPRVAGPLNAIGAAVVGVVVQLALFFAGHVLWPQGMAGGIDLMALLLTVTAATALIRYKRNVIEVICAGGGCGLILGLVHAI